MGTIIANNGAAQLFRSSRLQHQLRHPRGVGRTRHEPGLAVLDAVPRPAQHAQHCLPAAAASASCPASLAVLAAAGGCCGAAAGAAFLKPSRSSRAFAPRSLQQQ